MNPVTYIKDTVAELKLVTWPTGKQTLNLNIIVLGISVFVGIYVGGLDFVFTNLLKLVTAK